MITQPSRPLTEQCDLLHYLWDGLTQYQFFMKTLRRFYSLKYCMSRSPISTTFQSGPTSRYIKEDGEAETIPKNPGIQQFIWEHEVFIMPLWFLLESSHSCGILWNHFWQGALPKLPFRGPIIPVELSHSGIETRMVPEWTGMEFGRMQLNRYLFYNYIFYLYFNNICQMYYVFTTSRVDRNHVHQHQRQFNINPHKTMMTTSLDFRDTGVFFFFLFPFLFRLLIII